MLPCLVEGSPTPNVTWFLNGEEDEELTIGEYGALTLYNVTEKHNGEIKCVAKNDLGEAELKFNVTVHVVPGGSLHNVTPSTVRSFVKMNSARKFQQTELVANASGTVELLCSTMANPPPQRTWTFGTREIDKDNRVWSKD
jgi:hypothetical protein